MRRYGWLTGLALSVALSFTVAACAVDHRDVDRPYSYNDGGE